MGERSKVKEAAMGILESVSNLNSEESALNLATRMKNDPDPFIRACLRENPTVFNEFSFILHWKEYFQEATHLERLALVRNPSVYHVLIEKLFDPEEKELGISLEERTELVFAFLSNEKTLTQAENNAWLKGCPAPPDGGIFASADSFLRRLWELASKWSKESGVPYLVYRYVPVYDDTRVATYNTVDEPKLRRVILENCGELDRETIQLGLKDDDEWCRYWAYRKIRGVEPAGLEAILKGEGSAIALTGLARNKSLPVAELEKVRERLLDLKDDTGIEAARDTIEEIQKEMRKKQLPRDPEKLFAEEGREGNFLDEKIDFIGKTLLSFQQEVTGRLLAIQAGLSAAIKALGILVVIGIGVFLFRWLFR
jgi:hypothetical protein